MAIQYLFDENVDPAYVNQIRRRNPDLVVLAVGELTAPSKGTLDPKILIWLVRNPQLHSCYQQSPLYARSFNGSSRAKLSYTRNIYPEFQDEYWSKY